MKRNSSAKRLAAAALALVLLLTLTACGQSAHAQDAAGKDGPSDTLKGIYEALIAPESDYSRNKAMTAEYFPELEYGETLGTDRITLSIKANGNEYFTDGSWDFVQDGDWLTATFPDDDYAGLVNVIQVARAVGTQLGMEPDLVSGYLNGLGMLGVESDDFTMTEEEAAGTTTCRLHIAGPWEMKELDQMVLDEAVLDGEALDDSYLSQGGSVGKLQYMLNGNVSGYTALIAEFGGLDDIAYQSIVNLITLRKPVGYEAFLADFTELKALETDDYTVDLDPDDETIGGIMGERDDKYSYVLLRFGSEKYGEEEHAVNVPDAEVFADAYFRTVAAIPQATAGASLIAAATACNVLGFAAGNELWLSDVDTLRANMLEAWESLTDEERANFDANFPALNELLNSSLADWEANRSSFDDAGVADTMEELMEDGTSQWSWDTLSAHTWTLGNSEG